MISAQGQMPGKAGIPHRHPGEQCPPPFRRKASGHGCTAVTAIDPLPSAPANDTLIYKWRRLMRRTFKGQFGLLAAILFCATSVGFAQQTQIKEEPIQHTSPASGEQMYNAYCAVCHGKTGEGNGPAASALKVPPANLTTMAKQNNGKFPMERVISILRFGTQEPTAHGTSKMPIWGPLFSSLQSSSMRGPNSPEVSMRISNLARYIEKLQKK